MSHYIISFLVVIDGKHTEHGQIGSVSSEPGDYKPNKVKKTIDEQYRKRFPDAKSVAIKILEVVTVTSTEYVEASKKFIEFI